MPKKVQNPDVADLTPAVQEGPYYKTGSPATAKLYQKGIPGERVTLSGLVLDTQSQPLAGAWLDFWQADGDGHYDNVGFKLRGHQYTDKAGGYSITTVLPGSYPGRTPHIHVKVRATPHSQVLTTQLFIPGLASNKTDFIYLDALQMEITEALAYKMARFDFRLAA
jgi:protocatechuate 3,4-dioxygenase beta subunit